MNKKLFLLTIFIFFTILISCTQNQGRIGGSQGTCTCSQKNTPVCGTDKVTYPNSCFADCAKVDFEEGAC